MQAKRSLNILLNTIFSIFLISSIVQAKFTIKTSPELLKKIGLQVWQNECNKSLEQLVCWNNGEDCASLGIGHFIWYPKKHKTQFVQTFPKLLKFLEEHKISIPKWLKSAKFCPWQNRQDFYKNLDSQRMKDLKSLLLKTVDLQTKFLLQQAKDELSRLSHKIALRKRATINKHLDKLLLSPGGTYAVIDYINFKGLGLNPQEQYNGHSWGLYSVLLEIKNNNAAKDILEEFTQAAVRVLAKRIQNAPKNRDEKRWLDGWKKRLETYKEFEATK